MAMACEVRRSRFVRVAITKSNEIFHMPNRRMCCCFSGDKSCRKYNVRQHGVSEGGRNYRLHIGLCSYIADKATTIQRRKEGLLFTQYSASHPGICTTTDLRHPTVLARIGLFFHRLEAIFLLRSIMRRNFPHRQSCAMSFGVLLSFSALVQHQEIG